MWVSVAGADPEGGSCLQTAGQQVLPWGDSEQGTLGVCHKEFSYFFVSVFSLAKWKYYSRSPMGQLYAWHVTPRLLGLSTLLVIYPDKILTVSPLQHLEFENILLRPEE